MPGIVFISLHFSGIVYVLPERISCINLFSYVWIPGLFSRHCFGKAGYSRSFSRLNLMLIGSWEGTFFVSGFLHRYYTRQLVCPCDRESRRSDD